MPTSFRAHLALLALLGVFIVPFWTASLNGLTHVLTCRERSAQPFTIEVSGSGVPTLLSAESITRGATRELCGGLTLDMAVGAARNHRLLVVLPIRNHTRYSWHGSVKLVVGGTSVPVGVGRIGPGRSATGTVDLRVGPGTHQLSGSILVGP